jgi:hypothetical protein
MVIIDETAANRIYAKVGGGDEKTSCSVNAGMPLFTDNPILEKARFKYSFMPPFSPITLEKRGRWMDGWACVCGQ